MEPDRLREKRPTTYTPDGQPYRDYALSRRSQSIYDLWLGGPLVPNQLFIYGIAELTRIERDAEPVTFDGGTFSSLEQENPFGLVKLSWHVSDDHILDFTYINDTRKYEFQEFITGENEQGFLKPTAFAGTAYTREGGGIYIGSYTGYLTDELTLSAHYGELRSKREEYQVAANGTLITYDGVVGNFNQPGCPLVLMNSTYARIHPDEPVTGCSITPTIPTAVGKDQRKAGRLDLEYRAPGYWYGTHTLKAGYEVDDWSTFFGESYSGGAYYLYFHSPGEDGMPGTADDPPAGPDGQMGTSDDFDYVRLRHFQTGADVAVKTRAFYLKDSWDLDNGLLLSLGLRNDSFRNLNGAGQAYVQQDDIWQPRIGLAWDVLQDASQKVYGSFGVYLFTADCRHRGGARRQRFNF